MSIFAYKKVVVTGGAGFLGSHLVERLVQLGAEVTVVDDLRRGANITPGVQILRQDAGDVAALVPIFRGAFAVFNLAAHVAGVIYNQSNHLEMYRENERILTAAVTAAERAGVERFLQTSSVCVYSPEHNHPALEVNGHAGEPVAANNGYSWAKRMGERAVAWSRIPHAVIVRPSNLYGPRDHFDGRAHVIPALIKKALGPDPVMQVYGTGKEIREFLYVDDCAAGMIAALEHGAPGLAYNLGAPERISIGGLTIHIQQAAGVHKPIEFSSEFDAGDPGRWSDSTLVKLHTGWRASVSLAQGLAATVAWYKEVNP